METKNRFYLEDCLVSFDELVAADDDMLRLYLLGPRVAHADRDARARELGPDDYLALAHRFLKVAAELRAIAPHASFSPQLLSEVAGICEQEAAAFRGAYSPPPRKGRRLKYPALDSIVGVLAPIYQQRTGRLATATYDYPQDRYAGEFIEFVERLLAGYGIEPADEKKRRRWIASRIQKRNRINAMPRKTEKIATQKKAFVP